MFGGGDIIHCNRLRLQTVAPTTKRCDWKIVLPRRARDGNAHQITKDT